MNRIFICVVISALSLISVKAQVKANSEYITISNEQHHFATHTNSFTQPAIYSMSDASNKYMAYVIEEKRKKWNSDNRIEIYDMKSFNKLWEIKYNTAISSFKMTDYGLLEFKTGSGLRLYDYTNGERLWKLPVEYLYGIKDDKFFIPGMLGIIEAYSLKNCKKVWKANLDYESGISTSYAINDSISLLALDKLYKINWNTGKHEKIDIKIAVADKGAIFGSFLGFTPVVSDRTAIRTNTDIVLPVSNKRICGLSSSIIFDNGRYYIADRNGLMCFDENLNIIWKTEYTEEKATKCVLRLVGENLYLVSLGYGLKEGRAKKLGHPFVAGFKASDGTQLFYEKLCDEKKYVFDVSFDKEKACILFENTISTITFKDNTVKTFDCDTIGIGTFRFFLEENREYIKTDGCLRLYEKVYEHPSVCTIHNRAYEISPTAGNKKLIGGLDIFYSIIGKYKDYEIIRGGAKSNELWCIENGKAVQLCNNVKRVWVKDNIVSIITTSGNSILYMLDKRME